MFLGGERPSGIDDFYWKVTPTRVTDTEGGLYLEPQDLARIGYLFLHDGVWNEKRILAKGWVAEATAPIEQAIYGFQWWVPPHPELEGQNVFMANGLGGQYLIVIPQQDLIAVFTGWNINGISSKKPPEINSLLERVLAAVID